MNQWVFKDRRKYIGVSSNGICLVSFSSHTTSTCPDHFNIPFSIFIWNSLTINRFSPRFYLFSNFANTSKNSHVILKYRKIWIDRLKYRAISLQVAVHWTHISECPSFWSELILNNVTFIAVLYPWRPKRPIRWKIMQPNQTARFAYCK